MSSADEDLGTGRRKHACVGNFFQGGGMGGSYLWVGDMVDKTPHELRPGGVPAQGSSRDHGTETMAASGHQMGLPPPPPPLEEAMW